MNTNVGQKIKELLKIRNIKNITLAKHIGISASRLSNYISGKRDPDLDMLANIAEYLGVDLNYFSNTTFSSQEDLKKPTITQKAIEVPYININDKRKKVTKNNLILDHSFIKNTENPVIIKIDSDMCRIFKPETYILASPLTVDDINGTIIIKPGRRAYVYRYTKYESQHFLYDLKSNTIIPVNPKETYYAARLILSKPY